MKTAIIITGQIGSTFKLRSVIDSWSEQIHKFHNRIEIHFHTKKEAIKALSEAYQRLCRNTDDFRISNVIYTRGDSLHYDAGIARIVEL